MAEVDKTGTIADLITKGFNNDTQAQVKVNELMKKAQSDPALMNSFRDAADRIKGGRVEESNTSADDLSSTLDDNTSVDPSNQPTPKEMQLMGVIKALVQENKALRGGQGASEPSIQPVEGV